MRESHNTVRQSAVRRDVIDRDRLIQLVTLCFTLMIAIACSGVGSSGSSGKKKKDEPIHIRPFGLVVDPAQEVEPADNTNVPVPGRR